VYKQNEGGQLRVLNDVLLTTTSIRDEELFEGNVRYVVRAVGLVNSSVGTFHDISYPLEQTVRVSPVETESSTESIAVSCYPNPATSTLAVDLSVPTAQNVTIAVYDVKGVRVATLLQSVDLSGDQKLSWDLVSEEGVKLRSGIYFVRMQIGNQTIVKEFTILH
jgi:hypothetical protein